MKHLQTFGNFLNEGRLGNSPFNPKDLYLIGKSASGKYTWDTRAGFKTKNGKSTGDNSMDMETLELTYKDQGFTDIKVVTGNELAIMIASGETDVYAGIGN